MSSSSVFTVYIKNTQPKQPFFFYNKPLAREPFCLSRKKSFCKLRCFCNVYTSQGNFSFVTPFFFLSFPATVQRKTMHREALYGLSRIDKNMIMCVCTQNCRQDSKWGAHTCIWIHCFWREKNSSDFLMFFIQMWFLQDKNDWRWRKEAETRAKEDKIRAMDDSYKMSKICVVEGLDALWLVYPVT